MHVVGAKEASGDKFSGGQNGKTWRKPIRTGLSDLEHMPYIYVLAVV